MSGVGSEANVILPLPHPRGAVPLATHVRGMVIVSSQRSVATRGLEAQYRRSIPAQHREALTLVVAPSWVPMEAGLAHYRACDRLSLDLDVIHEIGLESGRFLYSSTVQTVMRLSTTFGSTPWTVLRHIDRFSARTWQGGAAFEVRQVGPKEAELEWHGQPCARIPYFQRAFGGFLRGCVEPLCRTSYCRVLKPPAGEDSLAYRLSWA